MEGWRNGESGKAVNPPYVSFKTFLKLFEFFGEVGTPQQFDRTVWGRKFSGSDGSQLKTALRFFGLIDGEGIIHEDVTGMATDPKVLKAKLKEKMQASYGGVFQIDLATASKAQLRKAFDDYKLASETKAKAITFFIFAAQHVGITLSQFITAKSAAPPAGAQRRTRRADAGKSRGTGKSGDDGKSGEAGGGDSTPPGVAEADSIPLLRAAFQRLPKEGEKFPVAERDKWISLIKTAFAMVYKDDGD